MNTKNDEDIQPLTPEEIKAIGEIELGPAKHEIFLNKHYKKLLWGGIGLGIAAGCIIAFFSHRNDMKQDAAAEVVAAMKLTAPAHGETPATYDSAALDSLAEHYSSTPSADTATLLGAMKALASEHADDGIRTLEALATSTHNDLIKARALCVLASHYLAEGQQDKAAAAWQQVADLGDSPYAALAHITIGDLARAKGDLNAARTAYQTAEAKCPTSPLVTSKTVQMRLLMLDVDAPVVVQAEQKEKADTPAAANPFGDEEPASTEPTPSLDDLIK